jgi:transposase-like protein
MVGMTKTSEDKWRGLIAAQEKSGMGVREFAESRGLSPATMYWWRSRLRERTPSLVPVAVTAPEIAARIAATTAAFELEIGAMVLRIPAGFDEVDLQRLLRALRC